MYKINKKYDVIAARSCSCSYKQEIPSNILVSILLSTKLPECWMPHIFTFLSEIPNEWVYGVLKKFSIPFNNLVIINNNLSSVFKVPDIRIQEIKRQFG